MDEQQAVRETEAERGSQSTRNEDRRYQAVHSLIQSFIVSGSMSEFLDKVIELIQRESGCQCIGIRVLNEEGYMPYQAYSGFSREFWEEENMIQVFRKDCGCTRVVADALLPCDIAVINPTGSLCINDVKSFGESLSCEESGFYRGACVRAGYQSLYIIPIVYNGVKIGLFHMADLQPNKISPETVNFVESIAPLVGEVLHRHEIERHLKTTQDHRAMLESIVGGIGHLIYVVNLDTLDLMYVHKDVLSSLQKETANYKCHELFAAEFCRSCPARHGELAAVQAQRWEYYDGLQDRHYWAECKTINWLDDTTIHAAFVSDITEQRKAEQALRDSNIELQQLSASLEEEIMERQTAQEELGRQAEKFKYQALRDTLTGLPNRLALNNQLQIVFGNSQKRTVSALFFIDLDDLKMVNDTFGHSRGDTLIMKAAALISEGVGADGFVARVGGDEFIVILSELNNRARIAAVAERILAGLRYEYEGFGTQFQMSASIGIALYPEDGDNPEEIMKNADNAMYAAKNAGKNCWRFYESSMQVEAYEKMVLTGCLRTALKQGELFVQYQPQIATQEPAVIGFEALLRWQSQQHGAIPPIKFIPLAEQSGLIQSIGKWVLAEACRFINKLEQQGWAGVRVSVNVSPYQLLGSTFIRVVEEVIAATGVKPQQLEIEITETAMMTSLENTICNLKALNELGIRVALDDFGTGYSSLTHLHRLPVQTLKIDKSFIDQILLDRSHTAIIKSIVDMAHNLEVNVVAEGVENKLQLEFLRDNRCDCIQGYYFCKPVSEQEAIRFLEQYHSTVVG